MAGASSEADIPEPERKPELPPFAWSAASTDPVLILSICVGMLALDIGT